MSESLLCLHELPNLEVTESFVAPVDVSVVGLAGSLVINSTTGRIEIWDGAQEQEFYNAAELSGFSGSSEGSDIIGFWDENSQTIYDYVGPLLRSLLAWAITMGYTEGGAGAGDGWDFSDESNSGHATMTWD